MWGGRLPPQYPGNIVTLNYLSFSILLSGAQIIDLMMLVIDVTKGMQTQSAEVKMKDHKVIGLW